MASDPGRMKMKKVFIAEAITQNTGEDSLVLELQGTAMLGIFSIYVISVGAGTLTFTYKLSFDNVTFLTPAGASDIKAGHTAGSDIISFGPELAPWIKITATETNVGAITSLDVTLCVQ